VHTLSIVGTVREEKEAPRDGNGDLFSVLITSSDDHEHAAPGPVFLGDLVVRTPGF